MKLVKGSWLDRANSKLGALSIKFEKCVPRKMRYILRYFLEPEPCCQELDLELLRRHRDAKILRPMAHNTVQLGQLLAEFAPLSNESLISEMQWAALEDFSDFQRENDLQKPTIEDIRYYYSIFDKLYFFGTISKRVSLEFNDIDCHISGFKTLGCTIMHETHYPTFVIQLNLYEHQGEDGFELLLGTLLHEMIHAFLFMYSCDCSDKCPNPTVEHGPPWHIAAVAIETSAKELLGFENLKLGREDTLENEITSSQTNWCYWPLPEEFEKLKIDPVALKESIGKEWIWDETGQLLRKILIEDSLNMIEIDEATIDIDFNTDRK